MKANALRIGNWIQFRHTETPVRITLGDFVREYNDEHLEDYEPIPLTEEWLIKFGFNKVSDIWEFWKNSGWDLRQHKLENKWWLFYIGQDLDCVRIDYVHQLQNLYFALTGEELTIKTIDPK